MAAGEKWKVLYPEQILTERSENKTVLHHFILSAHTGYKISQQELLIFRTKKKKAARRFEFLTFRFLFSERAEKRERRRNAADAQY